MERLKDINESPCFFKHILGFLCKLFPSIIWPNHTQDGQTYDYYSNLKNDFIENDPFLSSIVSNAIVIIKNQTDNINLGANVKDTQDIN